MKNSEINFKVTLDEENVPESIEWFATDGSAGWESTKSVNIALWDSLQKNTARIDLWTKDMPVDEMKHFYIDCIGGMAQSLLNSTGDEYMAQEMDQLVSRLVEYIEKSENQSDS